MLHLFDSFYLATDNLIFGYFIPLTISLYRRIFILVGF